MEYNQYWEGMQASSEQCEIGRQLHNTRDSRSSHESRWAIGEAVYPRQGRVEIEGVNLSGSEWIKLGCFSRPLSVEGRCGQSVVVDSEGTVLGNALAHTIGTSDQLLVHHCKHSGTWTWPALNTRRLSILRLSSVHPRGAATYTRRVRSTQPQPRRRPTQRRPDASPRSEGCMTVRPPLV